MYSMVMVLLYCNVCSVLVLSCINTDTTRPDGGLTSRRDELFEDHDNLSIYTSVRGEHQRDCSNTETLASGECTEKHSEYSEGEDRGEEYVNMHPLSAGAF